MQNQVTATHSHAWALYFGRFNFNIIRPSTNLFSEALYFLFFRRKFYNFSDYAAELYITYPSHSHNLLGVIDHNLMFCAAMKTPAYA
jgi:hypothetical protein